MVVRRLAAALSLLGILAGIAWLLQAGPVQVAGGAGMHRVEVVGPGGHSFWAGSVRLEADGTVLAALEAAALQGNFTVRVQHSFAAWVTGIGPYEQPSGGGGGGWNYCVGRAGSWAWVAMAADARVLARGEDVRWVWVTDGGNGCTAQ
jgi:hypothetical protein